MKSLKNHKAAGNNGKPNRSDTHTIIAVEAGAYGVVTLAHQASARLMSDVPEMPVIAFKVFDDGRSALPVTLCGTDWAAYPERWAIRDPNGWALCNRGVQYRCTRMFLNAIRDKIAA